MKLPMPSKMWPTTSLLAAVISLLSTGDAIDCETYVSCGNPNSGAGPGADQTYTYGSATTAGYQDQVGDIYIPETPISTPTPVVVLVHGGYWYEQYRRANGPNPPSATSNMDPLAVDLKAKGYVVINLEYRRAGFGGGLPETFNDLINGVDALACPAIQTCVGTTQLDLDRVVMIGHSAGGHLALWRALEYGIPPAVKQTINGQTATEDLASAQLHPMAAVGLAAVSDFSSACGGIPECTSNFASCSAITNFLASGEYKPDPSPEQHLEVYSPIDMLQNANNVATDRIQIHLSHGNSDTTVGPGQSCEFFDAASNLSFIDAEYTPTSGEGHFNVIDKESTSWTTGVVPFLARVLLTEAPSAFPSLTPSYSPSDSPRPSLLPSARPSSSPSTSSPPTPSCNDNGICEMGEDCSSCPNDCISGTASGSKCGNSICEIANGEDCQNCPSDCKGITSGPPSNRFCCGSGSGNIFVHCDSRCTDPDDGITCTPDIQEISYCCGNENCEEGETSNTCQLDCEGTPPNSSPAPSATTTTTTTTTTSSCPSPCSSNNKSQCKSAQCSLSCYWENGQNSGCKSSN